MLHKLVTDNATDNEITCKIEEQMEIIYRIVGICFGIPPVTFEWNYYDKSKQFHTVGPVSPLEFYEKHVKPVFDVTEKVCILIFIKFTSVILVPKLNYYLCRCV